MNLTEGHITGVDPFLALMRQATKSSIDRARVLHMLVPLSVVAVLVIGVVHGRAFPSAAPAPAQDAIVLAELFTSEGRSSCPPADQVLTKLVQQQPIKGVTVIGMSENVDYWNSLGWVDPFSSPLFSSRQSEYAERAFHGPGVYTPQIVIDGSIQEVGTRGWERLHGRLSQGHRSCASLEGTCTGHYRQALAYWRFANRNRYCHPDRSCHSGTM